MGEKVKNQGKDDQFQRKRPLKPPKSAQSAQTNNYFQTFSGEFFSGWVENIFFRGMFSVLH